MKKKYHDPAPPDCNSAPSDIVVAAYEKYSAGLFAYAKSIIHGEDGALDAVQEPHPTACLDFLAALGTHVE